MSVSNPILNKSIKRHAFDAIILSSLGAIFYGNFACLIWVNQFTCEVSNLSMNNLFSGFIYVLFGYGLGLSVPLLKDIIGKLKKENGFTLPQEVKLYLFTSSCVLLSLILCIIAILFFGW